MVNHLHKLLLLLIIPGILLSKSMSLSSMQKLSPDLQALVAEKDPENAHLTDTRFSKAQTVTGPQQEVLYPVTIRSTDIERVKAAGIKTNSDYDGWSTARITYDQLIELTTLPSVIQVFQGDTYYPLIDIAVAESGADLVHDGYLNNIAYDGTGVIVLIIDTGIDWSHLDFRGASDTTKSRILYLWDQTLTVTGAEETPEDRDGTNFSGLDYGVEYTQSDIEDEIDGSAAGFVRETETHSHGTLVASAAAGNGASLSNTKYKGMAPGSDLVIVKAGNGSFSDNNLKDALNYAQKIAAFTSKPVVVNLSLGSQNNAHDGTSSLDEAVDGFTSSGNGRVAVVAAGNEGNELIHVTGTVSASSNADITITVPAYTANGGTSNDSYGFELWWNNNADVTAKLTSPNGQLYSRTADQQGTRGTTDGTITIINKTDSDHSNGDRRTYVEVFDANADSIPAEGDWTLRVTNNSGSTLTYHGWLFASTMSATLGSADSNYTIASPGAAASAITVAGHTSRWRWRASNNNSYLFSPPDRSDDIAYFSSIGPSRNGSQKPDLSASGRGVFAATSTDYSPLVPYTIVTNKYHLTQGTSISSPLVTGAVALMLEHNANLTAAQVKTLLCENATTDSYTGSSVPNTVWGYGKLNIFEALAKTINSSTTVDHDIYSYDGWTSNTAASLGTGLKMSVRFSPSTSGDVTGALFHMDSLTGTSGNVSFEIWSNNSGTPRSKLGSTVTMVVGDISKSSWSYIPLKDAGVSVSSGTDYHLVCLNTASGSISLRADNGSVDGRSYYNTGSSWSAYYDWRMRPIVCTDESTLDSSLPVELVFFNATTEKGNLVLKWATESEFENQGFSLSRRAGHTADWKLLADHTTHSELEGQGSSTSRTDYAFVDGSAKPDVKYDYRLTDIPYSAVAKTTTIVLEDVRLMIDGFKLFANYPNPFNPSTHIAYQIARQTDVQIRITDIQGREIRSWEVRSMQPGTHETLWEGLNSAGQPVGAGIYFATVQAGSETHSQKMLLIK